MIVMLYQVDALNYMERRYEYLHDINAINLEH